MINHTYYLVETINKLNKVFSENKAKEEKESSLKELFESMNELAFVIRSYKIRNEKEKITIKMLLEKKLVTEECRDCDYSHYDSELCFVAKDRDTKNVSFATCSDCVFYTIHFKCTETLL
ncbi:MAG: hypothetical protein WC933_03815 [Candidatus Paceibacterota bacterium]|jgi:hypothetical protein